jgi:hypothetical protein
LVTLAAEITDTKRAQAFKNSIKLPETEFSQKRKKLLINFGPKFLENCQQKLKSFVLADAVASFLIEDTLAPFPQNNTLNN